MAKSPSTSREPWAQYRQRMLAETGRFIEWGLAHPEWVIEIPAKRVEEGGFPRQVAAWFWNVVLSTGRSVELRRWRERLRGRRPNFLHRPRR